jgi:hypothetical protein
VAVSIVLTHACSSREAVEAPALVVAPWVDTTAQHQAQLLPALRAFLASKDSSPLANPHWLAEDFDRYPYPYLDIYRLGGVPGGGHVHTHLLDITASEMAGRWIVKLGLVQAGAAQAPGDAIMVYQLVARMVDGRAMFSKYTDYAVRDWPSYQRGSIHYRVSPRRELDSADVARQLRDIDLICAFWGMEPIPITYFSCIDPVEVFQIKGFAYHPKMYWAPAGGLAEPGGIIYAGASSEAYTHELAHIYTQAMVPHLDALLDEGLSTWMGGSNGHPFDWHRARLRAYLDRHPGLDLAACLDPYSRIYIEEETPLSYMVGALVCERAARLGGKAKVMDLLLEQGGQAAALARVGLQAENLNAILRAELAQPGIDFSVMMSAAH